MKMLWAIVIALSFACILNAAKIDYKIKAMNDRLENIENAN